MGGLTVGHLYVKIGCPVLCSLHQLKKHLGGQTKSLGRGRKAMKALVDRDGVRLLDQDSISLPPPQRQVWVEGLGDFWGEAMATAILSLCYLAGGWAGFSAERLREELEIAAREDFQARRIQAYNADQLRQVKKDRIRYLIFSLLTFGWWEFFSGKPWPQPRPLLVGVPHILPAPYSPMGLDWLEKRGYIRRAEMDGGIYIFPEPKLVRETRWQWDPPKED